MNNTIKTAALFAGMFPVLAGLSAAAEGVAVSQVENKPRAVSTTVDNTAESAFASDLKAAEDLLKGLSHERHMTPRQSGEYIAREMEKARKFYDFAKTTAIPHSADLRSRMKDPDGLIAEGGRMVEKDPQSWQGYDYVASGHYLKKDVDGAMENFEKAMKSAPGMQKDWYGYMLAGCYSYKKDNARALELYEGIIARSDNWVAVKSSYLGASRMLVSQDEAKAASYFDKGMTLCTPGERAALYKAGACDKFKGLKTVPEACAAGAGM